MFVRPIKFASYLKGIRTDAAIVKNESVNSRESEELAQQERDSIKEAERLAVLTQQTATILESVQRELRIIKDDQRLTHAELAQATIELATVIAENVIRRAINANEYGVQELVAEALGRLPASDSIVIHLNPTDTELLEQQQATEQRGLHQLHIQADPSLDRGDCYVDAGAVGILTTVEQQITGLRQWLLEGLDDGLTTTDDTSQEDGKADPIVQRFSNSGKADKRSGDPLC